MIYENVNGVMRQLNSIVIGKGTYPDKIGTALAGVDGVARKAMTIHEMIDHVELYISNRTDNVTISSGSNYISIVEYSSGGSYQQFQIYVDIILKDGKSIFQWPANSKYLQKHYQFTTTISINITATSAGTVIFDCTAFSTKPFPDSSSLPSTVTKNYSMDSTWYIKMTMGNCKATIKIQDFYIDGVSYPVTVKIK